MARIYSEQLFNGRRLNVSLNGGLKRNFPWWSYSDAH